MSEIGNAAVLRSPQRQSSAVSVEIHGICGADESCIAALVESGNLDVLTALQGNYSLVVRTPAATVLAASSFGPPNLYYVHKGGRLFVGPQMLDVVRQAQLNWTWNWRALADVSALEHCVGRDTLHVEVKKLEPGTIVQSAEMGLHIRQIPWRERTWCADASPRGAVEALIEACVRQAGRDPVVSMSAGFDSRLLLACLLASGVNPKLVTMGARQSTDAVVSAAIARAFGLQLVNVDLAEEQYWAAGRDVTRITGGTKTLQNWHTYLYAKQAALPAHSHLFIGSNGEAARSYYLDKGALAVVADALASGSAKRAFWSRKLRPIFRPDELCLLAPELAAQFAPAGLDARVERLLAMTPGPLLRGLDVFYTEQRVAHFISNGLALAGAHTRPVAPMLDRSWMAQIWNLPRRWKLDSAWHRYAIGQLCPRLLRFAEERTGKAMRPKPTVGYWLPRQRANERTPFIDYGRLLRRPELMETTRREGESIRQVADPEILQRVLQHHSSGANRLRAASFLLSTLQLTKLL